MCDMFQSRCRLLFYLLMPIYAMTQILNRSTIQISFCIRFVNSLRARERNTPDEKYDDATRTLCVLLWTEGKEYRWRPKETKANSSARQAWVQNKNSNNFSKTIDYELDQPNNAKTHTSILPDSFFSPYFCSIFGGFFSLFGVFFFLSGVFFCECYVYFASAQTMFAKTIRKMRCLVSGWLSGWLCLWLSHFSGISILVSIPIWEKKA